MDDSIRSAVLAEHLGADIDDIDTEAEEGLYSHGMATFLVLTDDEADRAVTEHIKENLWAFRMSFMMGYFGDEFDDRTEEALQEVADTLCESANPIFRALVGDRLPDLAKDAIASDGRGHFLNNWDGNEDEVWVDTEALYIYRQ